MAHSRLEEADGLSVTPPLMCGECGAPADSRPLRAVSYSFDTDSTAALRLPEPYRKKLRTTNMVEWLNRELRRRDKVIEIYPNEHSAVRLIGTQVVERHEVWGNGRIYLDIKEFYEWKETIFYTAFGT